MNKRIINIVAVFVILIGGLYLSQPIEADATSFNSCVNECLLFSPAECTFCWRICDVEACGLCYAEACSDGGEWHGTSRSFDPPIANPCDAGKNCQ